MRISPIYKQAFTLIELLTVMTCIGLLLAILIPSLRAGRLAMQRVTCQANLRQCALAWEAYLNDYDGAFYQGVNANLNYGGWKGAKGQAAKGWDKRPLNPYVGLPVQAPNTPDLVRVFRCPSDRGDVPGTTLPAWHNFGTSYQTNILLIGQDQIATTGIPAYLRSLHEEINERLKGLKRNQVCAPARLLLLGDYGWINQWMPGKTRRTEWHGRPDCHNLVFMDGHADIVKVRKGCYVTDAYVVLPFQELHSLAQKIQVEELSER